VGGTRGWTSFPLVIPKAAAAYSPLTTNAKMRVKSPRGSRCMGCTFSYLALVAAMVVFKNRWGMEGGTERTDFGTDCCKDTDTFRG
jgi:hypothetical protein